MLVLPVQGTTPRWAARLNEYAMRCYEDWCKLVVVHEDGGCTFQAGHTYVIGEYKYLSIEKNGYAAIKYLCHPIVCRI